jgi:uncharacterized damage-inducible protein DinB
MPQNRLMTIVPTPPVVEPAVTGAPRPMLEGYLGWQRATLLNICAGLTSEQLASRPIASTNLSLLGLVRHMSQVERIWFRIRAAGEAVEPFYDPALGKDYDFDHLDPAQAEQALGDYVTECVAADAAAAPLHFDQLVPTREESWSLQMVYVHMIGEYSRHNGHGDLLREAIDGSTGW